MTRDEIQDLIIQAENKEILLVWATRVGKTRASLLASKGKTLVICAENLHIENWNNEILQWCPERIDDFELILYHSLHKLTSSYDSVIYDEVHHGFSETRFEYLKSIEAEKRIFLSASVTEEMQLHLKVMYPKLMISHVNLQTAIDNGILPEPQVVLVETELDNIERNCIWSVREKKKETVKCVFPERWGYLQKYKDKRIDIYCTEKEYYQLLEEKIEYLRKQFYKSGQKEYAKNIWLQETTKRKRWLSSLKTSNTQSIIDLLENKRYICFVGSIEQAKELGGTDAIHSKQKESINQEIVTNFNSGEVNRIFAVNKLQEGMSLNNVQAGIISQLDNNDRSTVQRFGKVKSANIHLIQGNLNK